MIRVKICGITSVADALMAAEAGADAIGLVFAKSSRQVSVAQAAKISRAVGPWISVVGVFVNEKPETISRVAMACPLTALQLHGDESPEEIKRLGGYKKIKAFRIENKADLKALTRYNTDAFLFDAKAGNAYGGTGKTFDWKALQGLKIKTPWILSGGLSVKNIGQALKSVTPYGVDVSSGVEKRPGIKDAKLVKEFIRIAKKG